MTGEVLGSAEWIKSTGRGALGRRPFGTAIQFISPYRLSNPDMQTDTDRIRKGVEIDEYGAPQAYWFREAFPETTPTLTASGAGSASLRDSTGAAGALSTSSNSCCPGRPAGSARWCRR